jgi:hypothetical protein
MTETKVEHMISTNILATQLHAHHMVTLSTEDAKGPVARCSSTSPDESKETIYILLNRNDRREHGCNDNESGSKCSDISAVNQVFQSARRIGGKHITSFAC